MPLGGKKKEGAASTRPHAHKTCNRPAAGSLNGSTHGCMACGHPWQREARYGSFSITAWCVAVAEYPPPRRSTATTSTPGGAGQVENIGWNGEMGFQLNSRKGLWKSAGAQVHTIAG
jgi:ribosomal protein L37E